MSDGDQIVVSGIEVYAYGGVTEDERRVGQRYRLDLDLAFDTAPAGRSDDLNDTVSYAAAHDLAVAAMRERPFNLVEAAAERVAEALLRELPVTAARVRLVKLLPPVDGVVAAAGVEITRSRP
jgi:dihydroneopterin aldolase